LSNCVQKAPCVLVIKDYDGYVFGAYCSDYLEVKHKFYGNGETFLFTFKVITLICLKKCHKILKIYIQKNPNKPKNNKFPCRTNPLLRTVRKSLLSSRTTSTTTSTLLHRESESGVENGSDSTLTTTSTRATPTGAPSSKMNSCLRNRTSIFTPLR
jgi:hypothetical protein